MHAQRPVIGMIPTRIRQFPHFLQQVLQRQLVLRRRAAELPTFHLCFFSCRSYFKYLYCSLHSLVHQARDVRFRALVFSDEDQPLSAEQIHALRELVPGIRVLDWPKSMGWGGKQIASIWRAYALASEGAAETDVVARVDSDVFFFNDRIFRAVARSDADLVGDGHYVDFRYCQGGCYFLRVSAVRKINAMLDAEGVQRILDEGGLDVEDAAAYYFARRIGLKTWLTWFLMFPDELRNAGSLNAWQRWKFSCLHFVMKNKAAMLEAYEREVMRETSRDGYRQALLIP